MKRLHKIIFIIALIIMCFSVYSLAEINVSQKINFSWYNDGEFIENNREIYGDWNDIIIPKYLKFDVITNKKIVSINGSNEVKSILLPDINYREDFLVFASLGQVSSNGYNIKIKEITAHGNIIEIMTVISSPNNNKILPYSEQYPYDIIRIRKNDIIIDGELLFIFKDKNGNELFRNKYNIDKNLKYSN